MGMGMREVLKKLTIMDGMQMIMMVLEGIGMEILRRLKEAGKRMQRGMTRMRMPKAITRRARTTTMERGERVQVGIRKMRKRVVTLVVEVMTGTISIVVVEEEEEEEEGGRYLSRDGSSM